MRSQQRLPSGSDPHDDGYYLINGVDGEGGGNDDGGGQDQDHDQQSTLSSASPLQGRSPIPPPTRQQSHQAQPTSAVPYRSIHHRAPLPCEKTLGKLQTYSPRRPTTQASRLKSAASASPARGGGGATPLSRQNHFRLQSPSRTQNHHHTLTNTDDDDGFLPPVLQNFHPSPPPTASAVEAKLLQFDKITKGTSICETPRSLLYAH